MTPPSPSRADLASRIDHTLLRPDATRTEVAEAVRQAAEMGCATVCLAPVHLPVTDAPLPVCTVIGFPSGAHAPEAKAAEAALAVGAGAAELDMVVHLGAVADGDWPSVVADIAAVRAVALPPIVLKVIIESAALTPEQMDGCCRAAVDAGADMVKTSTGFHPAGGATKEAVERIVSALSGTGLGVKASGGIRTHQQALAMLEAGAARLGISMTRPVLDGLSPVE